MCRKVIEWMRAASPPGWRVNQLFDKFHIKIARNFTSLFHPNYLARIKPSWLSPETTDFSASKQSRPEWWKANIWRRTSNCSMISFNMRNLALLTCLHFGACLSDEFNDCTHTGWANSRKRPGDAALISIPASLHPLLDNKIIKYTLRTQFRPRTTL